MQLKLGTRLRWGWRLSWSRVWIWGGAKIINEKIDDWHDVTITTVPVPCLVQRNGGGRRRRLQLMKTRIACLVRMLSHATSHPSCSTAFPFRLQFALTPLAGCF
ncbi:hypothetical protein M758_UG110200 [Ceratodon purpureus]|nr:hypothetical protein M758_UG110200 [Ceratodon purpureus]